MLPQNSSKAEKGLTLMATGIYVRDFRQVNFWSDPKFEVDVVDIRRALAVITIELRKLSKSPAENNMALEV